MSSIIPTSQSPGLQTLTAQTGQIKDAPLAEGAAAADTAAPGGAAAAATASTVDGGDRVDLSREARIELWRAFSKEHFAKIIAASEARHRTGDAEADRITRTAMREEYDAFEKAYGPRPKGEVELKMDAWRERAHRLEKQRYAISIQISRYAEIDTEDSKAQPKYALIKDANGRVVGHIDQNGGASISMDAMSIFGGRTSYFEMMLQTSSAENPAEARFQILLQALLNGRGSIERTGAEFKPFVSRFEKENAALHDRLREISEEMHKPIP